MTPGQNVQLSNLARILVLLGGIVPIIVGIIGVIASPIIGFVEGFSQGLGRFGEGILQIIIGFIALLGHRQLKSLAWTIVILVLGIIAGGLGGVLLIIGALIALVIMFIKT
ncbi:MAG TPA: hypothetical protein VFE98_04505 [Candidatus Bathyarchaeia archaeon]|nr:hypothetical protein [Candidatus Bathyarchaeia archaeon]